MRAEVTWQAPNASPALSQTNLYVRDWHQMFKKLMPLLVPLSEDSEKAVLQLFEVARECLTTTKRSTRSQYEAYWSSELTV